MEVGRASRSALGTASTLALVLKRHVQDLTIIVEREFLFRFVDGHPHCFEILIGLPRSTELGSSGVRFSCEPENDLQRFIFLSLTRTNGLRDQARMSCVNAGRARRAESGLSRDQQW